MRVGARRSGRAGSVPLLAAALALLVASGCGDEGAGGGTGTADRAAAAPDTPPRSSFSTDMGEKLDRGPKLEPVRCPPGVAGCRSATGRIVYVERVDPDGDGDAHFVILDRQGITLPGLTSIDVRAGLRPRPLPGPGDTVSAAGPVQTGSFGQSQIHALRLRVAGR